MAANPMKGEAQLRLEDGRQLTVVFDFDALIVIEDMLDRPATDVLAELAPLHEVPGDAKTPLVREGRTPRLKELRAFFAAGLRRNHPEITLDEIGSLIFSDGPALMEAFGAGIGGAFGQADPEGGSAGDAKVDPPRPTRGAGRKA